MDQELKSEWKITRGMLRLTMKAYIKLDAGLVFFGV
jgi:hypothetical protein